MDSDYSTSADRLILGFGNLIQGDDGIGIHAVKMLSERVLPPDTRVVEIGVPGWDLATCLEGCPSVIIIDAVRMGEAPGVWRRFDSAEVRLIGEKNILSLHEAGISEGLNLAEALNILPERIVVYGMEPASITTSQELSPAVQATLPDFVEEIYCEIWNRNK